LPDIADLFSARVRVRACSPLGDLLELWPQEQAEVASAVPARQAAYAAGRIAAGQLLRELGFADRPLCADVQRVPCWPSGAVGAITHSSMLCVVVAALSDHVLALGVDTEPAVPLERNLWDIVCRAQEVDWLHTLPAERQGHLAKLLFCVKESVFKAWYPRSRQLIDFQQVEVQLDCTSATYRARIFADSPMWPKNWEPTGSFAIRDGNIIVGTEVEAN
jgi:4'-phosphopantetheinyl transferase EntD